MVESVHKIAKILNCFSADQPVLGNAEIAAKLNMNPSTVHHLVKTLCQEGILSQDESAKYRLGWKLLEWSSLVMHQQDITNEAAPYVDELSQRYNSTVHIGMFDQGDVIFVLKHASKNASQISTFVGTRKPAYCFSTGKILLSYNPAFVDPIVKRGLVQRAPNTITDKERLERELENNRKQGFAISDNENEYGLLGIAAPIRSYTGQIIAALNMVGPPAQMKGRALATMVDSVVNTANGISRQLGYIHV